MTIEPLAIRGAYVVGLERQFDERGFFARTFCSEEFAAVGLIPTVAQCSFSFNHRRGTLRGMHWQQGRVPEAKLVRCAAGRIFDVVVDVETRQWCGIELSAEGRDSLYIAPGLAHGFITLEDRTTVQYQMSAAYQPEAARGVRWDDPQLAIEWPIAPAVISRRDRMHPLLSQPEQESLLLCTPR